MKEYKLVNISTVEEDSYDLSFSHIQIGFLYQADPTSFYHNEILLGTYSGLVSLTNPKNTWSYTSGKKYRLLGKLGSINVDDLS